MAAFNVDWRGDRVEITKEGSVARRTGSYNGGIVYSSEPIEVNEVFQIRVDEMEMGWAGSLKFGVTVRPPMEQVVPKGILELYNRDDFWVLSGDKLHHDFKERPYSGPSLESLTRGDNVGLYVNGDGELHFLVKGKDQGVTASNIPVDRDMYVVADIYGQVKQISMDNTVTSVCHDTLMKEMRMPSQKSSHFPVTPTALAAARALQTAANMSVTTTVHANGLQSASGANSTAPSMATSTELSWKAYVQQQAAVQQDLCANNPVLAQIHRQHLASLFGTKLSDDDGSAKILRPAEAYRLLTQNTANTDQDIGDAKEAGDEEEDDGEDGSCDDTADTTG